MRIIDADELMEHVWRDKLDSRELIAKMVENAPTVKEIPTKIPIEIFEQLISQDSKTDTFDKIRAEIERQEKTGHWIEEPNCWVRCSCCGEHYPHLSIYGFIGSNYCPNCGAKMEH